MQELLKNLWNDELGNLDFNYEENIFNPELAALILCANELNYKELLNLKTYKQYLNTDSFFELKMKQIAVLNSINNNLLNPLEIIFYLEKLKLLKIKENIFTYLQNTKINSSKEFNNNFKKSQDKLENIYKNLQQILSNELKDKLDEFYTQLISKDYKIAFSGIFNAGKSSLINALLNQDFLGVSNAPETANLSVISYDENEKIKVNFYNEAEFNALKTQASLNEELNKIFNIDFVEHKSVEVKINELYDYTSANSSISIFVKDIEIHLNNEYLKNKINIIDTPGLDDVVISREQKSLEFLKTANCVLYLMTCTQALSIKDLEFLTSFAKNNPNSKLVLVLTKSDLISIDEQIKLKEYVKNRFNNELKNLDITPNYELFCVSASEFKKDNSKGEINALKAYLNDVCFNSTSSQEFINSISEKFKNLIDLEITLLTNINNSLKLDKNEYMKNIENLQNENAKKLALKQELEISLNEYLNKDYKIQAHELSFLAKNQAARIFDELNYDKNYSNEKVRNVIFQGFKDLLNGLNSSMSNKFLNDFNEIKARLNITKDYEIIFDKNKLQEIFEEFEKIINKLDLLSDKSENAINNKLNAIYLNINLNFFNFSEQKQLANEFLKNEFFSIYHIEKININEFNDENLLSLNTQKIEKLLEIKENLK
ncbi:MULTISPECIES: dynamin family protein [unclassified Campylobacter]|uniref:dynamin family protein n=1 Tax=unclassified Campylobacter TaxID=2593542 RepID=UPI001D9A8C4A|nr:dynamin family protein [Campylobacter sp. RM9331]MBZ8006440.1 dynamin family protein [Campylobacter sp. RM9332]